HISNLSPSEEFYRIEYFDDRIKQISEMTKKQNRDEVEQKIVDAIEICGLVEYETPIRVRILLKVTCLEALLLGKKDKDYLGWKLAEKISLLVGNSKAWMYTCFSLDHKFTISKQFVSKNRIKARIELEKKVKDLYEIRSDFVHTGAGDYEISV